MRNIITNGDFQGTSPALLLTGGNSTPSILTAQALIPGWTISGDLTGLLSGASAAVLGVSTGVVGLMVSTLSATGTPLIQTALPPGHKALYFASNTGTTILTPGTTSNLSFSQAIPQAPLATRGRRCEFSFWHLLMNIGRYRLQIIETVNGVSTTVVDRTVQTAIPGRWRLHREQYSSPVLALTAITMSTTVTITVLDAPTSKATLDTILGAAFTAFYLGVPDTTFRDTFDDAERILEPL